MIPPPAQRMMANRAGPHVTEVSGRYAIYVSNPEVADPMDMLRAIYGVSSAGSTGDWPAKARRFRGHPHSGLPALTNSLSAKWCHVEGNHKPGFTKRYCN